MHRFIEKYQQFIGALNYFLFILLIAALPFPLEWFRPLWAIWLVSWVLEGRWLQKENFQWRKWLYPVLLLIVFFLGECISLIWTQDFEQGLTEITKHCSCLAILIIGLFGVNDHYKSSTLKYVWVLSCLISIAAYSLVAYAYIHDPYLPKIYPIAWYNFLGTGLVGATKHHIYLSLSWITGFIFCPCIYKTLAKRFGTTVGACYTCILMFLLIAATLLSESKTAFIALFLISITMIMLYIRNKSKYIIIVIVALSLTTAILYSPRFHVLYDTLTREDMPTEFNPNIQEGRFYQWQPIIKHIPDYGFKGLGVGASQKQMIEYYQTEMPLLANETFGPHNYYLRTMMELGPLAVLFLLFIICYTPFCYSKSLRKEVILINLLFGVVMCFEDVWGRINAIYLFACILIIWQIQSRELDSMPPSHL